MFSLPVLSLAQESFENPEHTPAIPQERMQEPPANATTPYPEYDEGADLYYDDYDYYGDELDYYESELDYYDYEEDYRSYDDTLQERGSDYPEDYYGEPIP